MAVVAVSMVSMPLFAQKVSEKNTVCPEQCYNKPDCDDSCKPNDCCNRHCGDALKGVGCFEGLDLTDAQQQKLKEIKKPGKRVAEQDKATRTERAGQWKAARQAYLQDLKAVLTPEQYVRFLENNYVNPAPKNAPGKGAHRAAKKGQKGQRPSGPSINARGKRSNAD